MFDSSMVNEPSGFEPLKFYCNCFLTCFPKVVSNFFSENEYFGYKNNAKFLSLKILEISLNIQNGGANVGHTKSFKQ